VWHSGLHALAFACPKVASASGCRTCVLLVCGSEDSGVSTLHAGGEEVTLPAMLPVMTGTPGRTKWAGPNLGHHTEEVLREQLKLDDAAIVKLQQQKVI